MKSWLLCFALLLAGIVPAHAQMIEMLQSGGGAAQAPTQAVTSISLSNLAYTTGASGTVGTLTSVLSPSSPATTVTYALKPMGTDHSGTVCNSYSWLSISGASLNYSSAAPSGSQPGACITASASGVTPLTQAFTLTGSTQTIAGIAPTSASVAVGSAANTVIIPAMTATMSPASPAFSGTWALVASGGSCTGGNTSDFAIGSTTGQLTLTSAGSAAAAGTYTACVEALQSGLTSVFQAVSIDIYTPTSSSVQVLNPSLPTNPSGWTTISFTNGATTFSYKSSDCNSTSQPNEANAAGDCPVYANGTATGYTAWQLVQGIGDGKTYGFSLYNDQWSVWNGSSFALTGSGMDAESSEPPWPTTTNTAYGGPLIPVQIGNFASDGNANGATDVPWTSAFGTPPPGGWASRVPDLSSRFPEGPTNEYNDCTYYTNNENVDPCTISYDFNICLNSSTGAPEQCNSSTDNDVPDWAGLAAGTYNSTIDANIAYVFNGGGPFGGPISPNLIRIDIDHEKYGNCWFVWQICSDGGVAASVMVAGEQQMITRIRADLPGIPIGCESPGAGNTANLPYYEGDTYCDVINEDDYIGSEFAPTGYTNSGWNGWIENQQAPYGDANIGIGAIIEFAAQHGKPMIFPEWCDDTYTTSEAYSGHIINFFVNLFASITYSLGWGSNSYWDEGNSPGNCWLSTDFSAGTAVKQLAYAQPWPNGFYGTQFQPPPNAITQLPSAAHQSSLPAMPQFDNFFWSMLVPGPSGDPWSQYAQALRIR